MNELSDLGIEELGSPAGLQIKFRGCKPDESGAFEGDFFEVELLIPPLNMGNLKRLQAEEKERGEDKLAPEAMLDYVAKTTERALRQNYRGVPRWLIEQTITMENMLDISQKISGISGLIAKKAAVA